MKTYLLIGMLSIGSCALPHASVTRPGDASADQIELADGEQIIAADGSDAQAADETDAAIRADRTDSQASETTLDDAPDVILADAADEADSAVVADASDAAIVPDRPMPPDVVVPDVVMTPDVIDVVDVVSVDHVDAGPEPMPEAGPDAAADAPPDGPDTTTVYELWYDDVTAIDPYQLLTRGPVGSNYIQIPCQNNGGSNIMVPEAAPSNYRRCVVDHVVPLFVGEVFTNQPHGDVYVSSMHYTPCSITPHMHWRITFADGSVITEADLAVDCSSIYATHMILGH